MKTTLFILSMMIIGGSAIYSSCQQRTKKDLTKEPLIPVPASVTATNSSFVLDEGAMIYFNEGAKDLKAVAEQLAVLLRPATGYKLEVVPATAAPSEGIYLTTGAGEGDEGYELTITEDLVTISGAAPAGVFYGVQTLRQLLPPSIEASSVQQGPWEIATGTIKDSPEYNYRGMMLDVARHFFGVDDVKRLIDLLAIYKINHLHLHLSDDQGWRIEIKSWPKLTAHGGKLEVGGTEGGFYTQEQYKDIVKYAADRFITIVPEIDMPGHTNAALASYAELNCDNKARELYTGTKVGFSTLCTDKEVVYKFIDDVVREISEMTPGPYFHIGGDESHVTPMEDYIPFIERAQDIVAKYGKKVIGWDEIAHAGLKPNTIVQYWAKAENAIRGVEKGAKVLISPATKTYLDMQYDSTTHLGLHWAAYVEVDSAYMWDPATLEKGITKDDIIGVESALWTETITNMEELEYMVFPRLVGHAEIGWSPAGKRNWDEYKVRLSKQAPRFKALGIDYYKSKLVPWIE